MKGKNKQAWIETGYQMVAENGFAGVNIESLSRALNKNKSSFYHYFGEWELFEEQLLEHHLNLAKQFASEASHCQNIIPDMVHLFVAHKTDIFFHKQLRINRDIPRYKKCFERVYHMFETAILNKWISFLNLDHHSFLAAKFLDLLSENFLLQITFEKYTYDWLNNYLTEVSILIMEINARAKK